MRETSSDRQAKVLELATHYGIASSYSDGVGFNRTVDPETLVSILHSFGVSAGSKESIAQSLSQVRARSWQQLVEKVVVIKEGTDRPSLLVSLPFESERLEDVTVSWTIRDEDHRTQSFSCHGQDCQVMEEKIIDSVTYVRVVLPILASLTLGYYRVSLTVKIAHIALEGKTLIIVTPSRCYAPRTPSRSFGLSIQLYNVRTNQNWGIGDFRDLKGLLRWSGKELGASTVGISPLHDPTVGVISPYSPSSRLFFNPLYLDLEAIPEFRSSPAIQRRFHSKRFQKALEEVRTSRLVQYEKVGELKAEILEGLYRAFKLQHVQRKTTRLRMFEKYCLAQGSHLEQYSLFHALSEYFGTSVWRQWPIEYQSPDSSQVQSFLRTCKDRIRFVQYVQWHCEQQLLGLRRMAKRLNLAFTMYHDLPVGVHPDGADAWMFQEELASEITLGAPPDSFNLRGQNWGLMAPVPWRMREAGYRFFIETIRRNMQYGGMLRIDHALGLFRLFIIPEGCAGEAGTYVKTSVDEVLAILALESVRHEVMVVGEDLGVVTPEIRSRLTKAGILSYRLMPFEKTQTGKFRTSKQYPKQAIVSFATHDLPTFTGYWAGRDIEIKSQAQLYPTEQHIEQDWETRMKDRLALLQLLVNEKLIPKTVLTHIPLHAPYSLVKAVYLYLSRTSCRMLMIPLEDLLGEFEAPNLPGATGDAYPSWRIRLTQSFQSFRRDPRIPSLIRDIRVHR